MRIVATAVLLFLAVNPLLAQDRTADETALRARVAAFEKAYNARDAAAAAALYAPDADLIFMDGPLVTGRAAIEAGARRDWGALPSSLRIRLSVDNMRFLGPDVAILNTRAEFNDGPAHRDRGIWVVVRQAGEWYIAALRVFTAARM